MPYSNAKIERSLTPLLQKSNKPDSIFDGFRDLLEADINQMLSRRYKTPVIGSAIAIDSDGLRSGYKGSGTISTTKDNTTVTGTSTAFTTEFFKGDVIRVGIYGEALKIESIESATSLTVTAAAKETKSAQTLWLIPSQIHLVSAYYTAHAVLTHHFSEQAYEQDIDSFNERLASIAKPIYEKLEKGDLFFSDLTAQSTSNNNNRLLYINYDNDTRDMIDSAETILRNTNFIN